ncbi:MAG: Pyrrolo-quinoline quinone [Verrucomicrobia bacterium]|nr:Pyrrolo-quinoline quinone [Verrucomicrobiota bacterium]
MRTLLRSSILLSLLGISVLAESPPLAAPADAFEGVWVGTVTSPNDRANLGFAFKRGPHGLEASFWMPAMFIPGMNLGPAQIVDGTYTLPDFGVRLALLDGKLTGTFANPLLRVDLHRAEHFVAPTPVADLPKGPAPLWSRALGAETWASPVERDGIIYVGTADGRFHAIQSANGNESWSFAGAKPIYGEALATDDRIYFLDDGATLNALRRADGKLQWRAALYDEKKIGRPAPRNPTFNRRVPVPVLAEGTLYIGSPDRGLYALDAATGHVKWRQDLGAPIYASVAVDGETLIVGCYDGTVGVLDRASGRELRRTKLGGPIASAPVVAGDAILVGCRDYLLYGLRRPDLSIVWRDSYWFSWVESVPRMVDGLAYIGGSDVRRISAIEPVTGKTRWATDVRGIAWGTPVVTAHAVYEGTSAQNPAAIHHEGGITALDRETGRVKWRIVTPLPPTAERAGYIGSLVWADKKLIGAAFDGTVSAYPAN